MNNSPTLLAKHLRDVHFGGNWTWVNMRDTLKDVTHHQALQKVQSFNTIATLVFHTNYFVVVALDVFRGNPINAHDKFSFAHPPINSEDDWQAMLTKTWDDAEALAALVEQMPESKLWETFIAEKYGNYHRNILGIIEHTHYHLGQMALIKKMVQSNTQALSS
jgi:hypothetical protein